MAIFCFVPTMLSQARFIGIAELAARPVAYSLPQVALLRVLDYERILDPDSRWLDITVGK